MENPEQVKEIISEFIRKLMVMFGPAVALDCARKVEGLSIADDGAVTEMTSSPDKIIPDLIFRFNNISGKITSIVCEKIEADFPEFNRYGHASGT